MRILVADDCSDTVESLATLLEMRGHQVSRACNGNDALTAAAEQGPEAAILDVGMPGLSGFEVAAQLRELYPRMLLIAVTGWASSSAAPEDIRWFDHYLLKPTPIEHLCDLLAAFRNCEARPGRRIHHPHAQKQGRREHNG